MRLCFQAFIVPSFEAFTDLPKFPQNKTELLSLMAEDKVGGYRYRMSAYTFT